MVRRKATITSKANSLEATQETRRDQEESKTFEISFGYSLIWWCIPSVDPAGRLFPGVPEGPPAEEALRRVFQGALGPFDLMCWMFVFFLF